MLEKAKVNCRKCQKLTQVGKRLVTLSIKCYYCSECNEWLTPPGKPDTLIGTPDKLAKYYDINAHEEIECRNLGISQGDANG